MGPPTRPPNWLKTSFGLACPGGKKKVLAFKLLSLWYSKPAPWISLLPERTCTLTCAPPASPCSASKLLVTTFTLSIDSSAGTYEEMCGSQMFVALAPSIRTFTELRVVPFTLNVSARDGFDGTECALAGGVKPGSVANTFS